MKRKFNKPHEHVSKPGLTAQKKVRHFVQHNYHDHANDLTDENDEAESATSKSLPKKRRGRSDIFPIKLYRMLTEVEAKADHSHIVSWQPHGRAFIIHDPELFTHLVLPEFFKQAKLTSFQRQLNLYGFERLTRGPDAGAYYHELFLRDRAHLLKHIKRLKVKGTGFKAAANPDCEPRFYEMPYVLPEPGTILAFPSNTQQDVYYPKPPDDADEVLDPVVHNDFKPSTSTSLVSLFHAPSEYMSSDLFFSLDNLKGFGDDFFNLK